MSMVIKELADLDASARHKGLRDLIETVDAMGEVAHIDGADWNLEVGALVEMVCHESREGKAPALLWDNIKGYPKGFRLFSACKGISN